MKADEKDRLKAEAKCIIAERYFDLLRHFGGVPLVKEDYPAQASYDIPRATVEETVNFMTGLLDEAIACPELPWALKDTELNTWSGRYTKGAAMGLKAKILVFAASPLFNDSKPYYEGSSEAVEKHHARRLQEIFRTAQHQRWILTDKSFVRQSRRLPFGFRQGLLQSAEQHRASYHQPPSRMGLRRPDELLGRMGLHLL